MTNYENLLNLPLNCNANENTGALATQEILKMSQRDFSEVSKVKENPFFTHKIF